MTTTTDSFLPEGYTAPSGGGNNYFKLEKGENKFRILSKPIIGWIDWLDKKPLRYRMNDKPPAPIDPKKPIKHFWAFVVWSYKSESLQIMEITQSTIQAAIQALSKDQDWGNPFMYDIKVIRTGDGMETEYTINPVPHKPITKEIETALFTSNINLEALYDGGDPFKADLQHDGKENLQVKEKATKEKTPF